MTLQPSSSAPATVLRTEQPQDAEVVTRLLDRVFGPGRFTKVSERVREIATFAPTYSFCAWEGDVLIGAVRQSLVRVGDQPVVFLGPLAVESDERRAGLGGMLVTAACEAARAGGETAVLLVGDEAYFGRFGFGSVDAREIVLPGPVDPRRVLLKRLTGDAAYAGLVRADEDFPTALEAGGDAAYLGGMSDDGAKGQQVGIEGAAGLDGVIAAANSAASGRGLPPVHLWNPTHRAEIDIVIRKDGTWVHEGGIIGREALVKLFASILRRDPDGYWLVTPVEMQKITVEDAPFVAVRVDRVGDALRFLTNVGDVVEAGPDHPIRVETDARGEPRPYVRVRGELDALITRPVFYELAEMAEERDGAPGITSHGAWFPIGPAVATPA